MKLNKLLNIPKRVYAILCVLLLAVVTTLVIILVHEQSEAEVQDLSEDIALVTTRHGTKLINKETNAVLITDLNPDWTCSSEDDSLAVYAVGKERGYFNYYTGEIIVPTTYRRAWVFNEGLAGVEQDGKIGFINRKGEVAIPIEFPSLSRHGYAYVFHHAHCIIPMLNNKKGVIDTLGNWTLPPIYDDIELFEDFVTVQLAGELKKQIDYNGRVLNDHLIDRTYTLTYTVEYIDKETGEPSTTERAHPTLCRYEIGNKEGLMTKTGIILTPPMYYTISCITPDLLAAKLDYNGNTILLNTKGEPR